MKVLLLRSDSLRHRYLKSFLILQGFEIVEIIEVTKRAKLRNHPSITRHFEARNQTEIDYFSDLVNIDKTKTKKLKVVNINDLKAVNFAAENNPDLIITFGCGILGSKWLSQFSNQIMGIHLGLSPYYKGSGTNFFPFVNNELGAIGYTLMNLDKGIDTGAIIHQAYADFFHGDNIHTVGARLMRKMFLDITRLISLQIQLSDSIIQPSDRKEKIYKRSDFTFEALDMALTNIRSGSVDYFLRNIQSERNKFPIIRQLSF
jgi:methionyl-tRNA formyltransferase